MEKFNHGLHNQKESRSKRGEGERPYILVTDHAALPSSPVSDLAIKPADLMRAIEYALRHSPVTEIVPTEDGDFESEITEPASLEAFARTLIGEIAPRTLSTHNAELEREVKRLREALERIDGLEVMEINPSNYSHEDVCELNNNAIQAALIANAALYRPALSTSPQGGEHE